MSYGQNPWPPPGSSVGHARAGLLSVTGHVLLTVDTDEFLARTRYWVTTEESIDPEALRRRIPAHLSALAATPDAGVTQWQYAVANIGTFNSPERMAAVLGVAGANGWELVAIYDKGSNWFQGFEKGFMLLKRPVAEGEQPAEWCVQIRG
jgi:hypothetical protein